MWLKFILSGLIIAFCVVLGWLAAEKYRIRKKFFSQLAALNAQYISELTYSRKPLDVFLEKQNCTPDFAKLLQSVKRHESVSFKGFHLTGEETADYTEYFSMLGRGDTASQRGFFSAKSAILAEKKLATEKEAKARGELYIKLGLLAGLAFVILIL